MQTLESARDQATKARLRVAALLHRTPRTRRAIKEVVVLGRLGRQRLRSALRRNENDVPWPIQTMLTVDLPAQANDIDGLKEVLDSRGVQFAEGRHTIYLPPQSNLASVLGELPDMFPPGTGFKIPKTFAHPDEQSYLHNYDARSTVALLGNIRNQAKAAAALSTLDLGPRFLDVVHGRMGATDVTLLATEHVTGHPAEQADYDSWMERAKAAHRAGYFSLANAAAFNVTNPGDDFAPPDCNDNLIVDEAGRAMYVDAQQFLPDMVRCLDKVLNEGTEHFHFGGESAAALGGRKYLYQTIPGHPGVAKRDAYLRWTLFRDLLARQGVSVRGKVVMDVTCNSGAMLSWAMNGGAFWGVGWDRPQVVPYSRRVLDLLGAGRTTLVGTDLLAHDDFVGDLPPNISDRRDGVLFFLAAWQHVGVPAAITDLPWKWLIFEGHGDDSPEAIRSTLAEISSKWGATSVASSSIHDGPSGRRVVHLLVR